MNILDLSVVIRPGISAGKRIPAPVIHYTKHTDEASLNGMVNVFAGSSREDFGKYGWASERVTLHTRTGTHMIAPFGYGAFREDGSDALKIDEFPLEWGCCPGVVLDLTGLPDGAAVTEQKLQAALVHTGHTLQPLDVVLLKDGTENGAPPRVSMTGEALSWLSSHGIHVVGTQALGLADEARMPDCGRVCSRKDIFVVECMDRLEKAKPGMRVVCFPQKVEQGIAAWCRALAQYGL